MRTFHGGPGVAQTPELLLQTGSTVSYSHIGILFLFKNFFTYPIYIQSLPRPLPSLLYVEFFKTRLKVACT